MDLYMIFKTHETSKYHDASRLKNKTISRYESEDRTWMGQEDKKIAFEILTAMMSLHFPLIIVTNSVVLLTFKYLNRLHTPDNYVIAGLAFSDILNGIVNIPIIMMSNFDPYHFKETKVLCFVRYTPVLLTSGLSLAMLMLLAVDRFLALYSPFWYIVNVTNGIMVKLMFAIVLVHSFVSVVMFAITFEYDDRIIDVLERCTYKTTTPFWLNTGVVSVLLFSELGISLICTTYVAFIVWVKVKEIQTLGGTFYGKDAIRKMTGNAKITIVLMFLHLILIVPSIGLIFHDNISCADEQIFYNIVNHLRFTNCSANAVIYAYKRVIYKKAYMYLLTNWPTNWKYMSYALKDDNSFVKPALQDRRSTTTSNLTITDKTPKTISPDEANTPARTSRTPSKVAFNDVVEIAALYYDLDGSGATRGHSVDPIDYVIPAPEILPEPKRQGRCQYLGELCSGLLAKVLRGFTWCRITVCRRPDKTIDTGTDTGDKKVSPNSPIITGPSEAVPAKVVETSPEIISPEKISPEKIPPEKIPPEISPKRAPEIVSQPKPRCHCLGELYSRLLATVLRGITWCRITVCRRPDKTSDHGTDLGDKQVSSNSSTLTGPSEVAETSPKGSPQIISPETKSPESPCSPAPDDLSKPKRKRLGELCSGLFATILRCFSRFYVTVCVANKMDDDPYSKKASSHLPSIATTTTRPLESIPEKNIVILPKIPSDTEIIYEEESSVDPNDYQINMIDDTSIYLSESSSGSAHSFDRYSTSTYEGK